MRQSPVELYLFRGSRNAIHCISLPSDGPFSMPYINLYSSLTFSRLSYTDTGRILPFINYLKETMYVQRSVQCFSSVNVFDRVCTDTSRALSINFLEKSTYVPALVEFWAGVYTNRGQATSLDGPLAVTSGRTCGFPSLKNQLIDFGLLAELGQLLLPATSFCS